MIFPLQTVVRLCNLASVRRVALKNTFLLWPLRAKSPAGEFQPARFSECYPRAVRFSDGSRSWPLALIPVRTRHAGRAIRSRTRPNEPAKESGGTQGQTKPYRPNRSGKTLSIELKSSTAVRRLVIVQPVRVDANGSLNRPSGSGGKMQRRQNVALCERLQFGAQVLLLLCFLPLAVMATAPILGGFLPFGSLVFLFLLRLNSPLQTCP